MKKLLLSILLGLSILSILSGFNPVLASSLAYTNDVSDSVDTSVNINEVNQITNVVIFIRFQDEAEYVAPHDLQFYENLFNGVDVVSLRDYYLEVSYGQMDISTIFAVPNQEIIYYVDTENRSYYQPYDEVTNPNGITDQNASIREHELLKRATDYVEDNNLISDTIDLDVNNDGEIDCLSYLVSGEDEGWNSMLWPHKWNLTSYYDYSLGDFKANAPTINGLYAYTYTFELLGNSADYYNAVEVAVLAHETFHLISAPDLYHYYDYTWIDPIGYWGLMESIGSIPNHMLGYMKETYGNWIQNVDEITESGSYTLYPLRESGDNLYQINTGYSNEYIYLEYRDNVGLYESQLPSSGLLVYRVDKDYYDLGNADGYYDPSGNPQDEVFIFRPGIVDTIPPISFEDFDDELIDEDGDISNAALSDQNLYSEMGNNTPILMFHSDGSLMDIKIYNVIEHDGYVTFDVYIPPVITLQSNLDIDDLQNLYLVDASGLNYYVDITNVPVNGTVYYTLDGTVPDQNSAVYQGNPIEITAQQNEITIGLYIDGELMSIVSKEYQFSSSIETDHSPYGDDVIINWYINLNQSKNYSITFSNLFEIENDYDYLSFFDGDSMTEYTGTELQNQTISFSNNGLLIQFTSDYTESDFYGLLGTVLVENVVEFELIGEQQVAIDVFDTYVDSGYTLSGDSIEGYSVETSNSIDSNTVGDYVVQYFLYDDLDTLIQTITRTVHVIDSTIPEMTLIGDETVYLELGDTYIELGAIFSDNYDLTGDVLISGEVNVSVIGSYNITYNTTDESGNNAIEITRTVIVQDTTSPQVSLNPSLDSIEVGSSYYDYSVSVVDLSTTSISVIGTVDTTTPGTYIITYTVEDASGNKTSVIRVVTVYGEKPLVEFSLGNVLTTIQAGDDYIDGACQVTVNDEQHDCVTKESTVNTTEAGVYSITYAYSVSGTEYTFKRYVFVYDGATEIVVAYPLKKEEGSNL